MISRPLGNDVYLTFSVKVGKERALINSAKIRVLKNDREIATATTLIKANRVSAVIPKNTINTVGDYMAVFNYNLVDMGEQEYAIPFRITESVLGKKRVNADQLA